MSDPKDVLSTLPTCPFCEVGHLTTLAVLIICAYCKKAWQGYEFETDLRRLREQETA